MINNLAEHKKGKNSPSREEEYNNSTQDNILPPQPTQGSQKETSDLPTPNILNGDINRIV